MGLMRRSRRQEAKNAIGKSASPQRRAQMPPPLGRARNQVKRVSSARNSLHLDAARGTGKMHGSADFRKRFRQSDAREKMAARAAARNQHAKGRISIRIAHAPQSIFCTKKKQKTPKNQRWSG
jgi:hypothetical protein